MFFERKCTFRKISVFFVVLTNGSYDSIYRMRWPRRRKSSVVKNDLYYIFFPNSMLEATGFFPQFRLRILKFFFSLKLIRIIFYFLYKTNWAACEDVKADMKGIEYIIWSPLKGNKNQSHNFYDRYRNQLVLMTWWYTYSIYVHTVWMAGAKYTTSIFEVKRKFWMKKKKTRKNVKCNQSIKWIQSEIGSMDINEKIVFFFPSIISTTNSSSIFFLFTLAVIWKYK